MNMYTIIEYILIGGAFFTGLLAFLSSDHTRKVKLSVLFLALAVVFASISVTLAGTDNYPTTINMNFLAFGIILPQLVGRIFIQQRLKTTIFRLRKDKSSLLVGWIGAAFMVILTWLFLQSNLSRTSNGEPIYYDAGYFRSLISYLLVTIPGMIWCCMIAVERTSFYADGIFQGGTLLSWDNFRTYNWKHDQVELLLRSNGFWFSNRFILKIPVDEKKEVESILAQKIAREP